MAGARLPRAYAQGQVTADAARMRVVAAVPMREGVTSDVVHALDAAGVRVTGITFQRPSLDDVFLTLTGHQAARAAGGEPGGAVRLDGGEAA